MKRVIFFIAQLGESEITSAGGNIEHRATGLRNTLSVERETGSIYASCITRRSLRRSAVGFLCVDNT